MENLTFEMENRVLQIIEHYGLNPYSMSVKISVSEGTIRKFLRGEIGMKVETLAKILATFDEINPDWLIFGKGQMFRNSENSPKPYHTIEENLPVASEETVPMSQPTSLWSRYDAAQQEIGSLRERLAQAATTIANLHNELIEARKKQTSPSAPITSEPILV